MSLIHESGRTGEELISRGRFLIAPGRLEIGIVLDIVLVIVVMAHLIGDAPWLAFISKSPWQTTRTLPR